MLWGKFILLFGNENIPGPIILTDGIEENDSLKLSTDSYEVFVNDDKVGNKLLLTQTDDPNDLNDFLENNGFKNFKVNVVGNSIIIKQWKAS